MSKKKMSVDYLPARIRRNKRWDIIYYQVDPLTGIRERFRETFDLNRIKDMRERERKAQILKKEINSKLPTGWPYEESHLFKLRDTNIVDAIKIAQRIKCDTDRSRTIDTYDSFCNIFISFLKIKKMDRLSIAQFTGIYALTFLDYVSIERKIGNCTYNNYLEKMRALFMVLKEREYIQVNPFSNLKKKKITGKTRRAFNQEERELVFGEIKKKDEMLTLAVLLQFHCFIRPIEMRRIRFYMFDLKEGVINLQGDITKNKDTEIVTIPEQFRKWLIEFDLTRWNQRWLVFGKRMMPHRDTACSHNTMNSRQSVIIKKLHKKGLIDDIKGLTFYSWKDTGALDLFRNKINILEIMKQLRHKDLKTTQVYCQSLYSINQEIKHLNSPILAKK